MWDADVARCVFLQREYATEVAEKLTKLGLFVDVDNGENTLPKKIRHGEIAQYNFILGTHACVVTI